MIAHIAIAAALGAPLVGAKLGGANPDGPDTKAKVTYLTKGLKAKRKGPVLPRSTTQVELSPNGRQLVARSGRTLRFYAARSGRRLGKVQLERAQGTLSWLRGDRLLALSGPGKTTTVEVVDPSEGETLEPQEFPFALSRTEPLGGRQLVLSTGDTSSQVHVIGPEGELERSIEIPGVADLYHGRVVSSPACPDFPCPVGETSVYTLDVDAGTATPHLITVSDRSATWVAPSDRQTPMLELSDGERTSVLILDPDTFEGRAMVDGFKFVEVQGSGDGFLVSDFRTLRRYGTDGRRQWKARLRNGAVTLTFGNRILLPDFDCRTGDFTFNGVSAATGRLVAPRAGRYRVMEPSGGSDRAQYWSGRNGDYEDC